MTVRVKLFAVARELLGQDEVTLAITGAATAKSVREALKSTYPALASIVDGSLMAVDTQVVNAAHVIPPGAEIALIPPVSGGT